MPFRETKHEDTQTANLGFGIDITTQCNLNCLTCYYLESAENRATYEKSFLSMDQFAKAMNQAALAGFREIYILGGEPTVHPDLLEMLHCAAGFKFQQVLLVTNGILLADLDLCRGIEATGADLAVQRHVIGDGEAKRRVQDTIAGKKGTLSLVNQAFANVESVFEPRRVAVQCCITRPVFEGGHVYDVFRYARTRGFEHIIECAKASERFARGNPLDMNPFELAAVYDELQRIDRDEFGGKICPMTPQAYGKTCHMPENSVHCLVDGTIVPCVGQPFSLGNILEGDRVCLEDILRSPKREFFMRPEKRLHGHCANCAHVSECTGGCRGDAFFLTGCFSASAIQCPQLAKYKGELSLGDFLPANCQNCILKNDACCGFKKDSDEKIARYLGDRYRRQEMLGRSVSC